MSYREPLWPSSGSYFYIRSFSTAMLRRTRADRLRLVEIGYSREQNTDIVQACTAALAERGEK